MRVVLDIPRLPAQSHGGLLYVEHLLGSLSTVSPSSWRYTVHTAGFQALKTHLMKVRAITGSASHKVRITPLPEMVLYEMLRLRACSSKALYGDADVVHAVGARCVPRDARQLICTLQDVSAVTDSSTASTLWRFQREALIDVAQRSQLITTISDFSANEISGALQVAREKICVIPNGVDHNLFHPLRQKDEAQAVKAIKRFGLARGSYLFFMGGQAPRKNLPMLLEAFDVAKGKLGLEDKLVIAGSSSLSQPVQTAWDRMRHKQDVIFTGYLDQVDLILLLQSCKMLVFPSVYEGFGLPPLEAMACGVPVACSNAASLPEVADNAAVYFDPTSKEDMASAILRLAQDPDLQLRCIARGLARSSDFSWEKAAVKMTQLYLAVASGEISSNLAKNLTGPPSSMTSWHKP